MSDNSHQPVDVTAPTLEQAIEKGLEQLGLSRNDVIIEIVEEGSRGVLGMGAREAVVRLTPLRAPKNAPPAAPAPVEAAPAPEPEEEEEPEAPAHVEAEQEVEHVHDVVEEEEEPEDEQRYETVDGITYAVDKDGYRVIVDDLPPPAPRRAAPSQAPAPTPEPQAEAPVEEVAEPAAPEPQAQVEAIEEGDYEDDEFDSYDEEDDDYDQGYDEDDDWDEDDEDFEMPAIVKQLPDADDHEVRIAIETLRELLDHMDMETEIEAYRAEADSESEDAPWILNVQGTDLGILIGRRGETLNALQYVTRLIVSRELQRRANLVIDVEGYKARRETSLRRLALRMASQAKRMGSPVTLEPMPPNERRVIHIALREDDEVRTESSGTGNQRKVSIIPVEND